MPTTFSSRSPRLALLAAAALLALQAQAQTAEPAATAASEPEAATLPAIKASGRVETATSPVSGYTARRSATATRTDTPLNEIPQSISVISAEQIRDQNAQTMQEVLRYTPGVNADVYGLDNRGDWFELRGGSQGSTLLDGLRRPLTNWYGVVRDEPYAFERVEVLRGPASVMAGQNGPGGVVNLVSKRPQPEAGNEVSVQLGNHEHQQVAADLNGSFGDDGRLAWRLLALHRDSGTQVEYADIERTLFAPSIDWKLTPDTRLWVYAQYQKDESGSTEGFFPLEGTLYDGPNGKIPVERFVSEPGWDTYGGHRWRFGWELEHELAPGWTLSQRLRRDVVEGKHRSLYANYWEGYLEDGRSLNRTWYASDDSGGITNADLFVTGKLATGSVQHTLLAGVDTMRQRADRLYWTGSATALDVYTPTYGQWTPPTLTRANADPTYTGSSGTDQWGVVLQDQMKIGARWVLTGSIRHDRTKTLAEGSEDLKVNATSRSVGAVYLADGGVSPYLSYAESFEPQGASETGSAFQPLRGKQLEAGLKWQPATLPLTASAAMFRLKESGRVEDGDTPGTTRQLGDVEVRGTELELRADLAAWQLIAAWTRTRSEDTETGARLANVPENTGSLWAVHRLDAYGLPRVRAGFGVRHIGPAWDGYDTLRTAPVTVMDAMLGWDIQRWAFALNVTNLADKTYFAACLARGDCWYGTQRELVMTASYRW